MIRAQTGTNSLIYVAKWPNLVKEFSLSFQALVKVSFLFQHTLQLTFKDYDITNSCPITQSHCWRFFVGIWNSFFNLIGRLDAKQSIWELWNLMQSCDWTGRLVSSLAMGTSPYARRGVMTRIGNYSHVRADIFNPMVWGFLIYIQVTQLVLSVFTVVCFYRGLFLPFSPLPASVDSVRIQSRLLYTLSTHEMLFYCPWWLNTLKSGYNR